VRPDGYIGAIVTSGQREELEAYLLVHAGISPAA